LSLFCRCYMNATLQQLFMMPELRNAVLSASVQPEKRVDADMLWQFQRVMATLLHSDSTWADTEPFVKVCFVFELIGCLLVNKFVFLRLFGTVLAILSTLLGKRTRTTF
jgi:hypothetical protein